MAEMALSDVGGVTGSTPLLGVLGVLTVHLLRGDIEIAWSIKEPFCPGKGLSELKYSARLCIIKKKPSAHLCTKVRFIV